MCTNMGSTGFGGENLQNGFNGKWFGVSVINNGGKKTDYFFKQDRSGTMMRVGLSAAPQKASIEPQKFVENAKSRNRSVKIIPPSETSRLIGKRNEQQSNKPDYEMGLGTFYGNKDNRRAARKSRLASRRK